MRVAELWRYPVKSLAGERLTEAEVRRDGIVGDRLVQGYPLDDGAGNGVPARARDAGHEDVVPVIADGDAELDRLHCARLADDLLPERQLGSGLKGKFRGIAGAPEFGFRYFQIFDIHKDLLFLHTSYQLTRTNRT